MFPNKYLPLIIFIGLAIGIANYAIGFGVTLGSSLYLQTITSLIIGYGLLWIIANQKILFPKSAAPILYLWLGLSFVVTSLVASEIELINRAVLFRFQEYRPFSGSGIYIFNAILTCILGFSFTGLRAQKNPSLETEQDLPKDMNTKGFVPAKKGPDTLLINVSEIIHFEASDNFSFLTQDDGTKLLCDYSLLQLQERLTSQFVRVHRKYIINTHRIAKVSPYFKGRFIISFNSPGIADITSSASYTDVVKALIKL